MKDAVQSIIEKFRSIEQQMANVPHDDTARLTLLARERKKLEPMLQAAQEWLKVDGDLRAVEELAAGNDHGAAELALQEKSGLEERKRIVEEKLSKLLKPDNPRMDRNAIIEIRAGTGGDEAALFVGDLFRMYSRFAQSKGLNTEIYSSNPTGMGGLKEIILGVSGPNAFGWFHFEQGVHRVQRVPKTEAQGRIHTSTATVAVLTEPTEVEVKLEIKDLRIDTYRSSGAGGQHVNKTDSAIRITHVPTGLVVACQEERSQGQNRLRAMALLRARLQEAAEEKLVKERSDLRKKQVGTGERSEKIRTYNFPQDRITDHRINYSVHNMERFLSGEMDELVKALQAKEDELQRTGKI